MALRMPVIGSTRSSAAIVTGIGDGGGGAPGAVVSAGGRFELSMKARISSFNTLPFFPVAGTAERSIACSRAIRRTAGVARVL